ncbi:3-oxoacyl-ACP reductase FabG [bacterium]|nr:3-oxoacyl-ACP reductase FabG [bacterium]
MEERVGLITGAGSGIGKAVAVKLSQMGIKTVLNDISKEGLDETLHLVHKQGTKAFAAVGDISISDDVDMIVDMTISEFKHIDILINNAGIIRDNWVWNMSEQMWDEVLDVNLKGAFLCSRAAIRYMGKQKWGRIINVSSISYLGNYCQVNYSSSKAGLIGLTKTLALELSQFNITVNCVVPGLIDTPMIKGINRDAIIRRTPLKRLGRSEDVANLIGFLVSHDADFITGEVIGVDGGLGLGIGL